MFKKENFADMLAQTMNDILESEGHKAIFEPPKVKMASIEKTASAQDALNTTIKNLFKVAKALDKMGLKKSAQEVSELATETSGDIGGPAMTQEQIDEAARQAVEGDIVVEEDNQGAIEKEPW